MNERAFRLDFFIAICALLVSGVAAGAAAYQTYVISQQFGASVWPYLSLDSTNSAANMSIAMTNDGLGPALVKSAELYVDGAAVPGWKTYIQMLRADPNSRKFPKPHFSTTSVDSTTTIRPGESLPLVSIRLASGTPRSVLTTHTIAIELCYCSLNARCWHSRTTMGSNSRSALTVVPVCPATARIGN